MNMRFFWWIGLVAGLMGCEAQPYNPFKIQANEFFRQVKTVGLLPAVIEADAEEIPQKQLHLEQFLMEDLKIAGLKSIPSQAFKTIYDSLKEKMGPIYDPYSGKPDEEKKKALFEHAKQEYLRIHKVDAFAYTGVKVVKAEWSGNTAWWHGTQDSTTGKTGFWAQMNPPNGYGTIAALSFWLLIKDLQGKECYFHIGGIQLYSLISNGRFVDIPKNQLLTDTKKNRKGIGITTRALRESNRL